VADADSEWAAMHIRVSPPAVAKALRDTFRMQGLVSIVNEDGIVEVHDPRAANDRDARVAITSAIGKWKTRFPQADAQLVDFGN
jgi:hypothetical protein